MKKPISGFTLIELIAFIIVTSVLASALFLSFNSTQQSIPTQHNAMLANRTAEACMEWLIGQRRTPNLNGFNNTLFTICPQTLTPAFCSSQPGFTTTVTVNCSPFADPGYRQLGVSVTGLATTSLSTLIASY